MIDLNRLYLVVLIVRLEEIIDNMIKIGFLVNLLTKTMSHDMIHSDYHGLLHHSNPLAAVQLFGGFHSARPNSKGAELREKNTSKVKAEHTNI